MKERQEPKSDDFQLGKVFKVALIIGGIVLALGLIGILIT